MAEESDSKSSTKSGGSRWWEYYAMRYALGVGIGTPIVALLWRTYVDAFRPGISIPSPFSGTAAAILWAAAGTAYCYVASVPMLTLHSTRRFLSRAKLQETFSFGLAAALIVTGVLAYFHFSKTSIGAIALIATVSFQLLLICKVLCRPDETHLFYDQLSDQRMNRPDFVESYRHMREHGNAVSIVIFELLLAFILWSLEPVGPDAKNLTAISRIGLILAAWLAPSTLVWLIGSSLERYLSRQPPLKQDASESPPEPASRDIRAP